MVKPLFGSEGRGLVRVSDRELARRAFTTLERLGAVLYAQKAVRHPGHDFRAFVLGGRVLGAIRRFAPEGDWRTNVAVGGRPEACRLDAALGTPGAWPRPRPSGAEMAGVDLLDDLDRGEPVVLEVNAVPGWRALAAATGVDVAAAVLGEPPGASTMTAPIRPARSPGSPACSKRRRASRATSTASATSPTRNTSTSPSVPWRSARPSTGPGGRRRGGRCSPPSAATRQVVASNTNLGMVLLLAPLAAVPDGEPLRRGSRACCGDHGRRRPARLRGDPAGPARRARDRRPSRTSPVSRPSPCEVMGLAAGRDAVARQYANGFADVFDGAVRSLRERLNRVARWKRRSSKTHLLTLPGLPDTLIARKRGRTRPPRRRAGGGGPRRGLARRAEGVRRFEEFDDWLTRPGARRNPGRRPTSLRRPCSSSRAGDVP